MLDNILEIKRIDEKGRLYLPKSYFNEFLNDADRVILLPTSYNSNHKTIILEPFNYQKTLEEYRNNFQLVQRLDPNYKRVLIPKNLREEITSNNEILLYSIPENRKRIYLLNPNFNIFQNQFNPNI